MYPSWHLGIGEPDYVFLVVHSFVNVSVVLEYMIALKNAQYNQLFSNHWMCRQWNDEQEKNLNISTFENWIKDVVHNHPIDPNDADDMDNVIMCSRPS